MSILGKVSDWAKRRMLRRGRYKRTFSGPDGNWVLRDLLHRAHVGEPSSAYDEVGRIDAGASAFRDGRRSLALEIARELNLSDAEILRQAKETNYEQDDEDET